MQHPFLWGVILGAAGLWAYEHYFNTPKLPLGKFGKG